MTPPAEPASAGSQCVLGLRRGRCRHLDGEYTAFGQVTKGMGVVGTLAKTDVDPRSGQPRGKAPTLDRVRALD